MTFICYEVFPVTLASQHAVLIRQHQEQKFPAWMIPTLPNRHPNDIVVRHLVSFFGDSFDSCHMIVHSTSWRYEPECDRLLLTYIAVLPQGPWLNQWHAVLAHALDHLASLSAYDLAIRAILEPEWREILRWRSPKPAGCLQLCS